VLPNNKNIVPVAEQLATLTTKRVLVVPTRSVPEGLAAMIAYMPGMDADDTAAAMSAAAKAVSWGEVTQAVRDAKTPVGACSEGDWLGIVGGDVTTISTDLQAAATRVLDALVDDHSEVVTIVTGADADDAGAKALIAHLRESHRGLEVSVLSGGQPLYPYLFGVE
jgi:dihydroxyacetone kinase-like predicted kinase